MARDSQYWFPAKRYGWGWGPPLVWQGWVVLIVFMLALPAAFLYCASHHTLQFMPAFVLLFTAVLLLICWLKGEPPRWRWGGD